MEQTIFKTKLVQIVIFVIFYLVANICLADVAHPRIISLAPNLTEIAYAAGAGQYLVAVDSASDFPDAVKALPIVATYNSLDLETIASLKPDLVIAPNSLSISRQLDKLQKLGIKIARVNIESVNEIPKLMRLIGKLADTSIKAEQAASEFEQSYRQLQEHYQQRRSVSVFYQIWGRPLMTAGANTPINQLISACGGYNAFVKTTGPAPIISIEAVLVRDPQVILLPSDQANWRSYWEKWHQLTAVKANTIYVINPDWLDRYGPRIILGTKSLCEVLDKARERL